jgi:hypothetical protein
VFDALFYHQISTSMQLIANNEMTHEQFKTKFQERYFNKSNYVALSPLLTIIHVCQKSHWFAVAITNRLNQEKKMNIFIFDSYKKRNVSEYSDVIHVITKTFKIVKHTSFTRD